METSLTAVPAYERSTDLKRLKFVIDTLRKYNRPHSRVLDVGCGNGIMSLNLGREGFNVTGIDVSEKAIAKAKAKNSYPNVHFECLSAEALMAQNDSYEFIICSEVLEHLENPADLLSKIRRMLKDDGKLIVTVPNGKGPRETLVTRPTLYVREHNKGLWNLMNKTKSVLGFSGTTVQSNADNLDHIQFFSKKDLLSLSIKTDFEIIDFGNANFVSDVFPYSMLANRIRLLQDMDCKIADALPNGFSGGFLTVWQKVR